MSKLLVIVDREARSNFLQENQWTPIMKIQLVHELKMTKIHDANDKPLHILEVSSFMLMLME